ncbi:MAG: PHP domain-containing protein, partial [Erysipelotrichaceae bacterium]|nr:PHP domain-containing protein [Erysipelotrichaceae bacterium]
MSTQLYVRSIYTLLSSMCTVQGIVKKAKAFGYAAVVLVDRNVLSGAMAFRRECEKEGIRPVYGMELDVEADERVFPVVLYARNDEGFTNLMKLSSHINTKDLKTVDPDTFRSFTPGNIVMLLSDAMPLTSALDRGDDIRRCLDRQKEIFGERYVVGLADHDIAINARRDIRMKSILKDEGIVTVAVSRTFYPEKEDYREYEILKCIRDKRTLDDNVYYDEGRYFLNREETEDLYDADDIRNAERLALMCDVRCEQHTSL